MKHTVYACLALVCLLTSCVKIDDPPTESTYTFSNGTSQRITLDIYGNEADYARNANQIHSYFIQPGASQAVKLKIGEKYWIDWYNYNYSLNNWSSTAFNNGAQPAPELHIAAEDDSRVISAAQPDTIRSILLNGSGIASTWKGTLSGTSGWDGTHQFTFRKDYTCDHVYTNTGGMSTTSTMNYQIEDVIMSGLLTERFEIRLVDNQSGADFVLTSNLLYGFPTTGRDSLLFGPSNGNSGYGFAVRQP